ncbi:MAG TPA: tetratricopeptide repeat protein [Vicinamibacterales bacterium]|jgi:tetratricopeptide (TPR) repeat protein|nr:tetratricopeptide repeat protein [Vicinamibacterales bacterium]
MTDNPRIGELRRRFERDPSSIAFAQLAEEYRRSGDLDQAVKICREGLARHPGYLSAQVTLGRALMELEHHSEARKELEAVLQAAPDNLTAIRALEEISQRQTFDWPVENVDVNVAVPAPRPVDPALAQLEQWLDAIVADRSRIR